MRVLAITKMRDKKFCNTWGELAFTVLEKKPWFTNVQWYTVF